MENGNTLKLSPNCLFLTSVSLSLLLNPPLAIDKERPSPLPGECPTLQPFFGRAEQNQMPIFPHQKVRRTGDVNEHFVADQQIVVKVATRSNICRGVGVEIAGDNE